MGVGARRMGKGHASAGVWPWAVRGMDAEPGHRAGTTRSAWARVTSRHCGVRA
jgi:hypothetical protein